MSGAAKVFPECELGKTFSRVPTLSRHPSLSRPSPVPLLSFTLPDCHVLTLCI